MPSDKDMGLFDTAIMQAYKDTKDVSHSETFLIHTNDSRFDFNVSSMLSLLIQETGRFTERFASDIVISINAFLKAIEDPFECDGEMFLFGIREAGVDHYEFIRSQMKNMLHNFSYFEQYYRRIYAIVTTVTAGSPGSDTRRFTIEMKEIRHELSQQLWYLDNK